MKGANSIVSQWNEKIIREDLQLRTLHNPASETTPFAIMGVTGIRHLAKAAVSHGRTVSFTSIRLLVFEY